jgi:5-oxoprolinase (ATP-hydrolysing) subunit A
VRRAVRMVRDGKVTPVDGPDIAIKVDTICIHGDGPHAAEFAERLRKAFEAERIGVRSIGRGA